jgi:hypothetical protein
MFSFRFAPAVAIVLLAAAPAAFAQQAPQLTAGEATFVATADRCDQFLGIGPDTVDGSYTEQLVKAMGQDETGASLARIYRACVAKVSVNTADRRAEAPIQRR